MTVTFFHSFSLARSIFMRYLSNKYIDRIHTDTHNGRSKHTHTSFSLMNGKRKLCIVCVEMLLIEMKISVKWMPLLRTIFLCCVSLKSLTHRYSRLLAICCSLSSSSRVVLYSFVCQTRGIFPRWLPWFDFLIKKKTCNQILARNSLRSSIRTCRFTFC